MKNNIILNGINSNTITGLLIQELPPISMPKMRANIEEIDGRNGDIVTTLGYSAYTKEISIGLYGNYNIDDVITYFVSNSSGTVTFSNEPDKYYNYQILEQIDFNRLIRFKTAIVKLHVQPFKYSNVETAKTFTITDETSITIRNSGNIYSKPIITIYGSGDLGIYLNNSQQFAISLSNLGSITIDTNLMEAYNGSTLMNRLVVGNYDNFKLNTGQNTISWTGTITKIQISNFSRWI